VADVFVSYKAEDRRRVKPLVDALEAEGLAVWWDEQIGGGAQWRHMIEAELNSAKCVLVVWSNRSVGPDGTFVQDEATRAQQRRVYVPVLIDKVHLPLGFGETQALPLTGWHGNISDPRYQAVLAAVRRNVGKKGRGAVRAPVQPHVDRRTMIAGGAAATVAIAGVGAWALLRPSSAGAASDSIAVLPFENLSGDPNQAFFSDGIAEEIRSALARIAGLKVVGRTSSEAVRKDDAETAAKKLSVANILTGSVRQSPSTIRVTAELVDGHSGLDRWSQDYDRSPGDSIKIQTDIAENVAKALSAALGSAVRKAISVGGTSNAEAESLVLQAHELAQKEDKASYEDADRLLDRAIALDPNYADAYAGKSFVVTRLTGTYGTGAFAAGYAEALRFANIAVRLAPSFEKGYRARAAVYVASLELGLALSNYQRALQLAPGAPNALRDLSDLLVDLGRFPEALRFANQAVAGDPLDPTAYENRVSVLMRSRRVSDAIAESERIKRTSPELFNWPITLGFCYLAAGRTEDARASFAQGEQDNPARYAGVAIVAGRQHDQPTFDSALGKLKQLYGDNASYQYVQIDAQLGRKDQAFGDLERALQVKDPGLQSFKVDPLLDPIRSDTRYADILRKLNFPS
jgi:serine/threonine-protein kinase